MKNLILFLFLRSTFLLNAQDQDPKAKAILDEVSKTTKAYKTISADYSFSIFNKDKKQLEKWLGKVQIKGSKFKLDIPGNSIICDGVTLWNYNKDAKEVTIKTFDAENDEQNPAKIFTLYESGFKYKYDKEEKVGMIMCQVIDLFPVVKPEKKKFHTLKIYVDKAKKQVVQMKRLMKDGGVELYEIKSLKPNLPLADNVFVFDTKNLKADQINDERD
ncbi:MAG TPA: outer membrane lipoprotein carrier protein LolA [Bacteroidia bacterium]|nr:outer membrane lipoprotein carrier protein LolA [Bacteroidia bacterium]